MDSTLKAYLEVEEEFDENDNPMGWTIEELRLLTWTISAKKVWKAMCDLLRPFELILIYRNDKYEIVEMDTLVSYYFDDGVEALRFALELIDKRTLSEEV